MPITIFHNPACGTSRNTLAMIRQSGEQPVIVEYLKNPPDRARLIGLIRALGITARGLLREKGTPYRELGLDDPKWTDDELIDLMLTHPDPDQPPNRRDRQRHPAVPALRAGARPAAESRYRPLCQGRRRDRPGHHERR